MHCCLTGAKKTELSGDAGTPQADILLQEFAGVNGGKLGGIVHRNDGVGLLDNTVRACVVVD